MRQKLLDREPSIKNIHDAEEVMGEIKKLEDTIAEQVERRQAQINELLEDSNRILAPLERRRDALAAELEKFSRSHFAAGGPKSYACEWGKFGLRKQTRLIIDDIANCIKALKRRGLEQCIKVTETVNRHVLGQQPPQIIEAVGARRESRDIFFWETRRGPNSDDARKFNA